MKFKIVKGTESFAKLIELKERIIIANEAAIKVVEMLGATRYCKARRVLGGGISAIEFKARPEGYKLIESGRNLYYPKVSNKKDLALITDLPVIHYEELNSIVGFKGNQAVPCDRGMLWINTVDITWGKEEVIFAVEKGCRYMPISDAIEILESEYEAIEKKIKESK